MPPPVTPSPHRFVTKKEATVRKPATTVPLAREGIPPRSTPQFNVTPRFHFSSTPRPTGTQTCSAATPSASRYLTPAHRTPKEHRQGVIDTLSDDDLHDSIERDTSDHELEYGTAIADVDDYHAIEAPSAKRRRLSSSPAKEEEEHSYDKADVTHEDSFSSSAPFLPSPPAGLRRAIPTAASRFLTPAPPSTPAPSTANQSTFRKPPPFRPPDPSELAQSHSNPLPEQFSPHSKGRKYIPGGLAAELQSWLFNVESAIPSHIGQRSKEDPWLVRIVVDEVSGSAMAGMTLVSGRRVHVDDRSRMVDHLGGVRVVLAGEGQGTGLQRGTKCEVGKTVGIKGPVWEVILEGVKWGVGVDWKVLPG
ncbi:uncharacterized protein BP5553_05024 [Venustampulla echinocandica]|uniref:Uncharacterized protein n=1 Tax=Venustampulla echinocandica TaxID=2656787 RepID=A0A370TPZ1_9HELO|nr:uncharacterized protein BP5553_05024 [Venustampulla echinocandica]RDL37591.1 hypothetical protein BP5553_05024 [Venustampulla echinocandica]